MRVLFLDFDGVIVVRSDDRDWPRRPRREMVGRLNEIMAAVPDAVIVISSTWRLNNSLSELGSILGRAGFLHSHAIRGATPSPGLVHNLFRATTRGLEIAAWLLKHEAEGKYEAELESYVVLEDGPPEACIPAERWVQTCFETGLLGEHVGRAVEILNTPLGGS